MKLNDLHQHLNPQANAVIVKARYKKSYQSKYGAEQWGIIEGDSLILIDAKAERHGVVSLSRFVKSSITELTLSDIQSYHRQKQSA